MSNNNENKELLFGFYVDRIRKLYYMDLFPTETRSSFQRWFNKSSSFPLLISTPALSTYPPLVCYLASRVLVNHAFYWSLFLERKHLKLKLCFALDYFIKF